MNGFNISTKINALTGLCIVAGLAFALMLFWRTQENSSRDQEAANLYMRQMERARFTQVNDEIIGSIKKNFDDYKSLHAAIIRDEQRRALGAALLLFLALMVTSTLLGRRITKHIYGLTQAMARVSTEMDYSFRAVPGSHDELALLTDGLNQMLAQVQRRNVALQLSHDDLADQVAERKRSEEALRDADEKLRQVLENIADVFYITSPDLHRTHYVSPAYEHVWGRSAARLYAHPLEWAEAILPEDREHVFAMLARLTADEIKVTVEFRIVRPDGDVRWIQSRGFQVRDGAGKVIRITGVASDITDRKRAEAAVTRLAAIVESSEDAIISEDLNGIVTSWNRSAERIYGYTTAELVGKSAMSIIPADRQDEKKQMVAKIKRGESVEYFETMRQTKDGRQINVSFSAAGLKDTEGELIGVSIVARDITARKRVELQLQESIRFAQSTIDALSAHVCVLDENGAILATNMAWRRFAEANSPLAQRERTGDNYLQVCDAVIGPEAADAAAFATGIRAVTRGELANFAKEYSCDSPSEKRWFRGQVTRFPGDGPVRVVVVHENITTRRLADEERDKLMHLIEHSPDFIALAEMDGTITFVNGGGRKMLGLTAERHFSNLHLTDYVPEKWREFFRETVIATAIKDGIWRGEMQLRNLQTGSLIDVFRTVFMISDPTGQRRFFATVTQNITDRKRIERELRENTERMRIQTSALDAAANGVVITDCRGTIQWVNAAFTRLTGYPAAEVLGKNPRFLKSGHHPESFYRKIWSTILRGRVWMGEVVNRRKDGRLYHEENTITPVIDEGGAITHFIAVKQDITERKRAEEDLNFKTALLEAQVEAALDGILVVDNHGRQVVKNKRFIEVWNFPKEIAENTDDQKSLDFVTNQNKNATEFLKKVNHLNAHPREVSRDEIELIDGRFLDRYSSPVLSKEGKHYGRIWTFRDITDRKQAEASMQKMHEKLLDISREAGKSEVASSVLHNVGNVLNSVNVACCCVAKDLRNSKTANLSKVVMLMNEHEADLGTYLTNDAKGKRIRGYLAELAEHLVTEQTVALKELGELQSNIEHIKEIVARQQSYATVYGVNQTVQIKDLIDDALSMSFTSQFRRETQVSLDYELNLPRITLDKHKVLQILVNLIRNAKQACDGLAPNARRLGIRVANGTGFLRGAVVDNGVGISAENLKQVFNHGFSTKKDGHGFGLHNSAIAAKEMGGSLIAQSNGIGLGSVFTLELPLKAAPAANTPEENKPNYETLN